MTTDKKQLTKHVAVPSDPIPDDLEKKYADIQKVLYPSTRLPGHAMFGFTSNIPSVKTPFGLTSAEVDKYIIKALAQAESQSLIGGDEKSKPVKKRAPRSMQVDGVRVLITAAHRDVGKRINKLRIEKGYKTHAALARAVAIQLNEPYADFRGKVGAWCNGKSLPNQEAQEALSRIFGVSVSDIMLPGNVVLNKLKLTKPTAVETQYANIMSIAVNTFVLKKHWKRIAKLIAESHTEIEEIWDQVVEEKTSQIDDES